MLELFGIFVLATIAFTMTLRFVARWNWATAAVGGLAWVFLGITAYAIIGRALYSLGLFGIGDMVAVVGTGIGLAATVWFSRLGPKVGPFRLISTFVITTATISGVVMASNYAVSDIAKQDLLVGNSRLARTIWHGESMQSPWVHGAENIILLLGGTMDGTNPVLVRLNGKTVAVGSKAPVSPKDAFFQREESGLRGSWKLEEFLSMVRLAYPQATFEYVYDEARPEPDRWLFVLSVDEKEPPMAALPHGIQSRGGTILCRIGPANPIRVDEDHPVTQVFWKDQSGRINETSLTEFGWGSTWAWRYGVTMDSLEKSRCGPMDRE